MTENMAASIRQRLLNLSRETGERFQNLLTRYGIERLVYRLTQSRHSDDFILKGANLFYVWTGQLHRPTRDLDLPTATVRAYQFETAIAEKLEAMVKLGISNSRMKDFYDVYVLARDFEFDGKILQASIRRTFEKRETEFPEGVPVAWTEQFSEDDAKIKQWRAFLRKSQLDALPLADIIEEIRGFLGPVWHALQTETKLAKTWHGGKWK